MDIGRLLWEPLTCSVAEDIGTSAIVVVIDWSSLSGTSRIWGDSAGGLGRAGPWPGSESQTFAGAVSGACGSVAFDAIPSCFAWNL